MLWIVVVVFFFSSRRRHTRCYRDWSSDVCSSDLEGDDVFWRWGSMGVEHFERLGAAPEVLPVRVRDDASDPALVARVGQADFIYFSGGSPRVLLDALAG